jgi:serine protease
MQAAVDAAVDNGALVIASAGNGTQNVSNHRPANCDDVVAVAALNQNGDRRPTSNFGTGIDISAPGQNVLSTLDSGTTSPSSEDYGLLSGTSMAAPHISGLAALMLEVNPDLTANQLETLIEDNARAIPGTCTGGCGAGVADAVESVDAAGSVAGTPGSAFVTPEVCYGYNDVTWDSATNATSYNLYTHSDSGWPTDGTLEYSGSSTYTTINVSGTRYVRVKACNAIGCSDYRYSPTVARKFPGCS